MSAIGAIPRKIVGPRHIPIVSYYPRYIYFMLQPIREMRWRYKTFGKLSAAPDEFNEGEKRFVFAFGPEFNQQVLSNPAAFYSPTLGGKEGSPMARLSEGLIFINGERHKQHRRLVMPSFHRKYVESYRDDMVLYTEQMLNRWQFGAQMNIAHEMHQLTMLVANKTLFGLESVEDGENIGRLIRQWLALNVSPLARIFPYDRPGFAYHRLVRISNELEQRIQAVITHKRAQGLGTDVLSTLLQTRDEDGSMLSDNEVIANTNVLFIAGHETSANTLTWALFLLSQHPQVMRDVLDELQGKLQGAAPNVEQLGQLPLLEHVIKETMRLLPPLTWIQRNAQEDFEIGGYHIPRGGGVLLSHFITHRIPEIYEHPDKFLPRRWETINPSTYEYIAFSAGPRFCVGATFAMMEMKIVLAMLLQRYHLAAVAGAKINYRALPTLSTVSLPMTINKPGSHFEPNPVNGTVRELVELP